MNLTSKSRYALKIMIDLAQHDDDPCTHRRDIAQRQGVPQEYLDQIMIRLRAGGLVKSLRGRNGGYQLTRPVAEIFAWEIFEAAEGDLSPVKCLGLNDCCEFDQTCSTKLPWQLIFDSYRLPLQKLSLEELAQVTPVHQHAFSAVQECRAPANTKDF